MTHKVIIVKARKMQSNGMFPHKTFYKCTFCLHCMRKMSKKIVS